jgi:predicted hotdog family 3-hydroxylacyl-ACP dehydratase
MNATILVPSGGGYFEGHFPGRPILPGVVELVLVLEALARDTGQPVSLQGIGFVRLRQLVLPGDRLELSARGLDSGLMRIDLKRDDVVVANGELILGNPDRGSAAFLRNPAQSMTGLPPIDALLPHRQPMRFVHSIVDDGESGLTCAGRIPSQCALVRDGSAPALAALELAAQTAATWEALRRWREGGVAAPRVGYLVAIRDVTFFAARIPAEQTLLADVRLEAAAPPLTHYQVEVALNGALVLQGTIATFLTAQE